LTELLLRKEGNLFHRPAQLLPAASETVLSFIPPPAECEFDGHPRAPPPVNPGREIREKKEDRKKIIY
jgi:hypothetical protein